MTQDQAIELYCLIEAVNPKPHEQIEARRRLVQKGLLVHNDFCDVTITSQGLDLLGKVKVT